MHNRVFEKAMENVRKHRNIKLVLHLKREEIIQYQNQIDILGKFFTQNLLASEMSKTQVLMNKPVYVRLSILDLSKTVMYDYVKQKYGEIEKHCYMNTDNFIVHVKTDDI